MGCPWSIESGSVRMTQFRISTQTFTTCTLQQNLKELYFKDLDGAILMYDIANAKISRDELENYHQDLVKYETQNTMVWP